MFGQHLAGRHEDPPPGLLDRRSRPRSPSTWPTSSWSARRSRKPAGVLDVVTDFGADPTGATDSTAKFQAAVDAGKAQGRAVWIPTGHLHPLGPRRRRRGDTARRRARGTRCSAAGTRPTATGPPASTASTSPAAATPAGPGARGERAQPQRHAAGLRHHRRHPRADRRRPGQRHRRGDDQLGGRQRLDAAHQGRGLDGRPDGQLHHPQQPDPGPDRGRGELPHRASPTPR